MCAPTAAGLSSATACDAGSSGIGYRVRGGCCSITPASPPLEQACDSHRDTVLCCDGRRHPRRPARAATRSVRRGRVCGDSPGGRRATPAPVGPRGPPPPQMPLLGPPACAWGHRPGPRPDPQGLAARRGRSGRPVVCRLASWAVLSYPLSHVDRRVCPSRSGVRAGGPLIFQLRFNYTYKLTWKERFLYRLRVAF